MKIVAQKRLDNCFESDFVFKYFFETCWTEDGIKELEVFGHLRYYHSFPRPMFHIQCVDGTNIKGVQGTDECRVLFARDNPCEAKKRFEEHFR